MFSLALPLIRWHRRLYRLALALALQRAMWAIKSHRARMVVMMNRVVMSGYCYFVVVVLFFNLIINS